jgi:hypothetical protein
VGEGTASARLTESKATIYGRSSRDGRSRVLDRASLPDDLRGASVLLLERKQPGERDMFAYRRSSGGQAHHEPHGDRPCSGTDFQLRRFRDDRRLRRKAQSTRADALIAPAWRGCWRAPPPPARSGAYTRIVEHIDPKTVRIKTELFEADDRLRKGASSDRSALKQVSGLWYAPRLTLRDLVKQTETELAIDKIEVGVEIPAKRFSQANLSKGK